MGSPARFGIVDMGSNAVRFLIAEAAHGQSPTVLSSHRLPIRLGREVFRTGRIPDADIAATVDACRRFRADCDQLGVRHVRAVATSAMRDAHNRHVLADRVREAAGIDVEVISGAEEAYLLKLGIESRLDLGRGRSLLVDVGGGSVEVVLVADGAVVAADSYRLGPLRMLAALSDAEAWGESFVELMHRHLHSLERRIAERLEGRRVDRYAAVGGNIETLADLVGKPPDKGADAAVEHVPLAAVAREVEALAKLSVAERIAQKGLREDRADTIVPAGIVYTWLGELAGATDVLVPRTGIKDGLLAEVVQGRLASFAAVDHADVVLSACRAMGRRFHYEADHAERVRHLARRMFDQMHELHGLDERARILLEAAALLHDVGVTVKNDGHHKHSQYLIKASGLVGLADGERHLVAMLARYHRKAPPSRDHEEFAALRRRDRSLVERLAAILRVADALDRQHAGVVADVRVEITPDRIDLHPTLAGDRPTRLFLETKAVEAKGAMLADLYGRTVRLLAPEPRPKAG